MAGRVGFECTREAAQVIFALAGGLQNKGTAQVRVVAYVPHDARRPVRGDRCIFLVAVRSVSNAPPLFQW